MFTKEMPPVKQSCKSVNVYNCKLGWSVGGGGWWQSLCENQYLARFVKKQDSRQWYC